MFKEKGELHLSANLRNCQVAYSVTNNLGFLVNGYFKNYPNGNILSSDDAADYKRTIYQFDAASGFFITFNDNLSFETFVGVGHGHSSISYYSIELGRVGAASNFYKSFLQSNFIINKIGLSCRLQNIDFYNFKKLGQSNNERIKAFFIEPAATLKIGKDNMSFLMQVQYSLPVGNIKEIDSHYRLLSRYLIFSVGINVRLDKILNL